VARKRNTGVGKRKAAAASEFATLLGKALAHPLRVEVILQLSEEGRMSPSALASATGADLGTLSYHFRQLHSLGLLRPAGRTPRRGAIEHFYELSPLGERALEVLRTIAAQDGD
jgi:DNA-binding transcriptional ArsR family regulator